MSQTLRFARTPFMRVHRFWSGASQVSENHHEYGGTTAGLDTLSRARYIVQAGGCLLDARIKPVRLRNEDGEGTSFPRSGTRRAVTAVNAKCAPPGVIDVGGRIGDRCSARD